MHSFNFAAKRALQACLLLAVYSVGWAAQPSLAPRNPAFERFVGTAWVSSLGVGENEPWFGLIPPPLDLSHNKSAHVRLNGASILGLPPSYDLRNVSPPKLTPVRSQGNCGSCWAFACYGSLESCLLPNELFDFSENHLKNTHGFDIACCDGGNHWMTTAYLARWSGPVVEADDPYNPSSCTSPSNVPVVKHIQRVDFLPDRSGPLDNDIIKTAVINYGAVYTSFYWNSSYYNSSTSAYYYNETSNEANHAVCIVGWDDNYSKHNFSTTPPGNGAFIIKNSWGTGFGQGGYCYISYYDTLIGRQNAVFPTAESVTNFDQIYQYDTLGWTSSLGYGTDTAWFANVFTATSNADLAAVSFYVASLQSSYELRVYLDPNAGPIRTNGGPVFSQTGTIANAGYQTVLLNSPIRISAGQRFSVVVKLTTPNYKYPVPLEQPISNYSGGATASPGQSYISSDGISWTDLTSVYSNSNVCIKAFALSRGGISVEPTTDLVICMPMGDTAPSSETVYRITNTHVTRIQWKAETNSPWISLSITGGTLGPGESTDVTVFINSQASDLPPGHYVASVAFTNLTNGNGNTSRGVMLDVFTPYTIRQARFSWIDTSAHNELTLSDDGVSQGIDVPFEFRLYERLYDKLFVGANGLIGFLNVNLSAYANTDIPNNDFPNAVLYPYWDDLNPASVGSVRVGTEGDPPNRKLVVSWLGVPPFYAPNSQLTFQVVLFEGTQDILFQYADVKPDDLTYGAGRSATIGIENFCGTHATKYSYNGSLPLANGQAILFTNRGAEISEVKTLPDGASVVIRRAVVTRTFGDVFYIESDDRTAGIRVAKSGHGLSSGMRADVIGVIRTNSNGERYVEASWVCQSGIGSVRALGLNGWAVGGSDYLYNPETGAGQRGVTAWHKVWIPGSGWSWEPRPVPGANNVGLLVQVWGRVTQSAEGEFYVDDGCDLRDASGNVGLRVLADGITCPSVGEFVKVTGIVSCYQDQGVLCRTVLVADQSDISVLD